MGIYLNPGKNAFEEAAGSEIFVDKTEMIADLNRVVRTEQKYVCVSRPRRFGKSMAVKMLCAYYGKGVDSRSLFEKYKISKREPDWDKYLGKFDVIRIVMTDFLQDSSSVEEMLAYLSEEVISELQEAYPEVNFGSRMNLRTVLNRIYGRTGMQFVIVIDEWDAIFREYKEDREGQKRYLDFLRDWLKDKEYVALAYMTGILPIKKYGEHSALNMFIEYSMQSPRQFASYAGFTQEEVRDLCERYRMNFHDVSDWYDGYEISEQIPLDKREAYRKGEYEGHKISIYSPLSVVESMATGRIQNYWNKTESYEALAEYIRKDYDGLKDSVALLMDGGRLKIDTSTYQNDMTTFLGKDDVLSLLVHLGYLGFDDETSEVFIPNREILDEFRTSTKGNEWFNIFTAYETSEKLLKAVWTEDSDKVAELLEKAHNRTGNKSYNDEAALSYAIQYAFYAAQKYYTSILELDTGKGYADLAYIPSPRYPDKPALLIELKYEKTADGAIAQIKRQNYPDRLEHYKGKILLIGINYNKDERNTSASFKHHSCRIEKA